MLFSTSTTGRREPMAATTNDVEIDTAVLQRVKQFVCDEPVYVSDSSNLVERLVAGMADSRTDALVLEEAVKHLIQEGMVVLGESEPDDLNADPRDPRSWAGRVTHRVNWQD